jgi:hypothetical protein
MRGVLFLTGWAYVASAREYVACERTGGTRVDLLGQHFRGLSLLSYDTLSSCRRSYTYDAQSSSEPKYGNFNMELRFLWSRRKLEIYFISSDYVAAALS